MSGHHHRATNPDIEADVPDEVANFLRELNDAVVNKDLAASQHLYEQVYPQLTQQFFTNKAARGQTLPFRSWPNLRFVKECFTSEATQLLYQMIVARHLFTDRNVPATVRSKSWETFTELFERLMDPQLEIDLPNGWLWDILDEFIYQLQTHHNKRLKLDASFPAAAWNLQVVAAKLEDIVAKSDIRTLLAAIRKGAAEPASVFTSGPSHVQRALGLFALITQMRLSVAVGDYIGGLSVLEPLCLFTTGRQITQLVAPAHVALFYNVGFSYMMLRRYTDAAAGLKLALLVKSANRPYVDALQAQVVSLLTLSTALGNLQTEDFSAFLTERARQNQEDDAQMLGHGDLERFRDVFAKSSPKFISVADITTTSYAEFTGQEGKEQQLRVFMRAVQQRVEALKLRGFLKVYSTIESAKITTLLRNNSNAASPGQAAQAHLVCLKGKSIEKVRGDEQSDLLGGEFKPTAVIDFTADGDRVTVVQRKERVSTAQRFLQLLQNI